MLREFWEKHVDARSFLEAWLSDIKHARWRGPSDIKAVYRNASFLADNRIVFNIKGNKYRLVVAVHYRYQIIYIRFIGTHKDYDRIDAVTV